MPPFTYRNGALHAEDVALATIAEAVGTPFYCYSSTAIEQHFEAFRDAFAGQDARVFYAMKANSNQAVLTTLARLGAGMDVVSEGELRRARAAGVPGERIIFSGVGKTLSEMNLALDEKIYCFNVESEPELEALSRAAVSRGAVAPVAIRVNPDIDARTHAKIATGKSENKFGVPISRARDVYAHARTLPGLSVRGVDMHIGSQITDLRPFDDAFALIADFVRALRADGHTNRARRSRRRPRHPLPDRQRSAAVPGELRQHRRPPHRGARLQADPGAGAAHRRQRRSSGRLGHLPQEGREQELRHRRCGDERSRAARRSMTRITTSCR